MFCHNCGELNGENAYKCVNCGEVLHRNETPSSKPLYASNVPSYLIWAILATMFCCLPLGVVAIVYATQVNSKLAAGDYAGAVDSSENARKWCWISFGVAFVPLALYILILLASAPCIVNTG